ncbi:MAG: hypothetical protein ACRYGR_00720, partial [Janthinobacterium lividum]
MTLHEEQQVIARKLRAATKTVLNALHASPGGTWTAEQPHDMGALGSRVNFTDGTSGVSFSLSGYHSELEIYPRVPKSASGSTRSLNDLLPYDVRKSSSAFKVPKMGIAKLDSPAALARDVVRRAAVPLAAVWVHVREHVASENAAAREQEAAMRLMEAAGWQRTSHT